MSVGEPQTRVGSEDTSEGRTRARDPANERYRDVAAFVDNLDARQRGIVAALRATITNAWPQLHEHVKWNSPTYTLDAADLMTINAQNRQRQVQLILHRGAERPEDRGKPALLTEDEGLVRWLSDIRGVITFPDADSVARNDAALRRVIERWIELT